MRRNILLSLLLALVTVSVSFSQRTAELPKFFLGASFGTSYSLSDFADTDFRNPDAGFAKNGQKIDLYGGVPLDNRLTLTGVLRYQSFATEIGDLIEAFNTENPGADFVGSTEDWRTYYFLAGLAYRVPIKRKFALFPRFGIGPLLANNPGISLNSPNTSITNNFSRSSKTGFGLGLEIGIGLRTYLGRRFALLPTFTFSGGFVTIQEVVTTTDNVVVTSNYQPVIQSFNLGISLAYRFY
ncbi:MAG: outer membrane beta-barrel protein [Bacteroidota bacterium]